MNNLTKSQLSNLIMCLKKEQRNFLTKMMNGNISNDLFQVLYKENKELTKLIEGMLSK